MNTVLSTNTEIVSIFFPTQRADRKWVCSKCGGSFSKGNGPGNLANHVKNIHKDYMKDVLDARAARAESEQNKTLNNWVLTRPDVKNIYSWMDFIVEKNLPFSVCEDAV
eukprot:CAMPEP_0175000766 /NCGR_PEP_ID=MMETSP0005-20121125/2772_1 /TAXON_ID=420556 /ORGANISM="Ochromonas sp., Strain CCMP1393" /LENGTH=108 /DNA_ID=CAMNT_0016255601 /DNA_START=5 /DNA_END=331 /DNA_ORIENTATION=+